MTADPVEKIRHDISHTPGRRRHDADDQRRCKSDLEIGVDYLLASARWRIHKAIDRSAEGAMHLHNRAVESAVRSIGQLFRRKVMR